MPPPERVTVEASSRERAWVAHVDLTRIAEAWSGDVKVLSRADRQGAERVKGQVVDRRREVIERDGRWESRTCP